MEILGLLSDVNDLLDQLFFYLILLLLSITFLGLVIIIMRLKILKNMSEYHIFKKETLSSLNIVKVKIFIKDI